MDTGLCINYSRTLLTRVRNSNLYIVYCVCICICIRCFSRLRVQLNCCYSSGPLSYTLCYPQPLMLTKEGQGGEWTSTPCCPLCAGVTPVVAVTVRRKSGKPGHRSLLYVAIRMLNAFTFRFTFPQMRVKFFFPIHPVLCVLRRYQVHRKINTWWINFVYLSN